MKTSLFAALVLVSLPALANIRGFSIESPNRAIVTIRTEVGESQRPSAYVDGEDNELYVFEMLKNAESRVSKLRAKIEWENCGSNSDYRERFIADCGFVDVSEPMLVSKSGAEGTYTFTMGLRKTRTARNMIDVNLVTFTETVRPQYPGMLYKTLKVTKITARP